MTASGYRDVDKNNPDRLVAALDRRANAALYEPYRTALLQQIAATTGLIADVGAGGGHLIERIKAESPTRHVLGIEPSAALVGTTRTTGIVRGTGNALPLASGTAGCIIAERVLQHVDDIGAVLSEIDRVLDKNGTILLVDPNHPAARLDIPQMQHLADRLVRWRAQAGTATPDAVDRSRSWLHERGYGISQETFWCATGEYTRARIITNFPEWAQLAHDAGEHVTEHEIAEWETHWRQTAESDGGSDVWFHWPVVLTTATRHRQ